MKLGAKALHLLKDAHAVDEAVLRQTPQHAPTCTVGPEGSGTESELKKLQTKKIKTLEKQHGKKPPQNKTCQQDEFPVTLWWSAEISPEAGEDHRQIRNNAEGRINELLRSSTLDPVWNGWGWTFMAIIISPLLGVDYPERIRRDQKQRCWNSGFKLVSQNSPPRTGDRKQS